MRIPTLPPIPFPPHFLISLLYCAVFIVSESKCGNKYTIHSDAAAAVVAMSTVLSCMEYLTLGRVFHHTEYSALTFCISCLLPITSNTLFAKKIFGCSRSSCWAGAEDVSLCMRITYGWTHTDTLRISEARIGTSSYLTVSTWAHINQLANVQSQTDHTWSIRWYVSLFIADCTRANAFGDMWAGSSQNKNNIHQNVLYRVLTRKTISLWHSTNHTRSNRNKCDKKKEWNKRNRNIVFV